MPFTFQKPVDFTATEYAMTPLVMWASQKTMQMHYFGVLAPSDRACYALHFPTIGLDLRLLDRVAGALLSTTPLHFPDDFKHARLTLQDVLPNLELTGKLVKHELDEYLDRITKCILAGEQESTHNPMVDVNVLGDKIKYHEMIHLIMRQRYAIIYGVLLKTQVGKVYMESIRKLTDAIYIDEPHLRGPSMLASNAALIQLNSLLYT